MSGWVWFTIDCKKESEIFFPKIVFRLINYCDRLKGQPKTGGKTMVSVNRVILAGNLASDPQLKETSNGRAMTVFLVAVNKQ